MGSKAWPLGLCGNFWMIAFSAGSVGRVCSRRQREREDEESGNINSPSRKQNDFPIFCLRRVCKQYKRLPWGACACVCTYLVNRHFYIFTESESAPQRLLDPTINQTSAMRAITYVCSLKLLHIDWKGGVVFYSSNKASMHVSERVGE